MAIISPRTNKKGSLGTNSDTRGSTKRFKFRSNSIFVVLIGCSLLYILGSLNVAIHVHRLDPTEKNLILEAGARNNAGRFFENSHNNNKEKTTNQNGEEENDDETIPNENLLNSDAQFKTFSIAAKTGAKPKKQHYLYDQIAKERRQQDKTKAQEDLVHDGTRAHGDRVSPDVIFEGNIKIKGQNLISRNKRISKDQILTAYSEITDRSGWNTKPLPVRNVKAEDLIQTQFSKLSSCSKLPEQWPVDDYPDADPFLPWIHDVFPTADGKFIQFVAQNRRRCQTGTTEEDKRVLEHNSPQVALFQHVPLKKLESESDKEPRYRLSSHEDADPESIDTRFICRFKPSGDITFSEFNNDYEWAAVQKRQKTMFSEHGRDNYQIQTSQLIFRCPVPDHLVELVRTGDSVQDDWASIFVDLIPVRTPPRYGVPDEFLVPRYAATKDTPENQRFNPHEEWGEEHILPKLDDSGRWENIPVCKPSLMTYEPQALEDPKRDENKKHHLVSCLWASTGYTTRGERYAINDGQRRLLEWITYNKILGFDHFYVYDNSGAHTNQSSLQPIADLFPEDVTLINWPSKVCNNNPNFHDSVGERSSQYAAETSCRLRFGSHSNWIGQFDIDEYLVPMGNFTSILPLLERLDEEGNKIISFASWRAWPRRTYIDDPEETSFRDDQKACNSKLECFELSVKKNTTILEAYNCDRQKPGEKGRTMPAEKQIYKADYVKQHFIHYSTITESSNLDRNEFVKKFGNKRAFPDKLSRFSDEVNEALMLHSKSIARQDTAGWKDICSGQKTGMCRIGFPWPEDGSNATADKDGWLHNCYVNPKIDNYFAPKLQASLAEMGFIEDT